MLRLRFWCELGFGFASFDHGFVIIAVIFEYRSIFANDVDLICHKSFQLEHDYELVEWPYFKFVLRTFSLTVRKEYAIFCFLMLPASVDFRTWCLSLFTFNYCWKKPFCAFFVSLHHYWVLNFQNGQCCVSPSNRDSSFPSTSSQLWISSRVWECLGEVDFKRF